MTETKPWWQSRTIWTGLVTSALAVLSAAGALPVWIDAPLAADIVVGLLGIATVISRAIATKEVVLIPPVGA